MDAEKERGRILCSVGKYRIRRKHPLPSTIWDGKSLSHCFSEEARKALKEVYQRTPYPTASEKAKLAETANLSVAQVQNWFKNKRQRSRDAGNNNKQNREETRPSFFLEHLKKQQSDGIRERDECRRELVDSPPTNVRQHFISYMKHQGRPLYCSVEPPTPQPIKPVFHKVKPMVVPVFPSPSWHTYTAHPRYVRCVGVSRCRSWELQQNQQCNLERFVGVTSSRYTCCDR